MKKKVKKILQTSLAFLLVFGLMTFPFNGIRTVSAEEAAFLEQVPLEVRQKMERQGPALEAHELLQTNLNKDGALPDTYSGTYINDEGKLVVQLVRPKLSVMETSRAMVSAVSPVTESQYSAMSGNSDAVVYEYVDYSYNELNALSAIAETLKDEYEYEVHGWYVDQIQNKVVISVTEKDYEVVQDYLEATDQNHWIMLEKSEFMSLTDGTGTATASSISFNLYGGDALNKDNNGLQTAFTLGICGTYSDSLNTYPAILTAGHGCRDEGTTTSIGSDVYHATANVKIGVVEEFACYQGDYGIVRLTENHVTTNLVRYYNPVYVSITGVYNYVPVGMEVCKYGITTGYSWGTVTAINATESFSSGDTITGMYKSTMSKNGQTAIAGGDSGGPVYVSDTGPYQIAGTVVGGNSDTGVMYTTPIRYAISAGFTPKTTG